MGNSASGQPAGIANQGASSSVESSVRKSPSPGQLDLSHLSPDERAKIQSVLTRQDNFERREQLRVEMLRKEMAEFERSVFAASNSTGDGISDGLCAICRAVPLLEEGGLELAIGEQGKRCDSCGRVCCLNCGQAETSKTRQTQLWVCLVCEKRYDFIMKSGLWFTLRDSCPTVADFGLQLHHKPTGAAIPLTSVKSASPEKEATTVPSIMVTRASVRGAYPHPTKKMELYDDPHYASITGQVSSDSDECGGFTPPPDGELQSEVLSGWVNSQTNGQSSQGFNGVPAGQSTDAGKGEVTVEHSVNGMACSGEQTQKSPSSSHQSPSGRKDKVAKPWMSSLNSSRREAINVSGNGDSGSSEVDGNRNSNGDGCDLDDDQPLSPQTWDRVRVRAKTAGEKEMPKKKDSRHSLYSSSGSAQGKRKLPSFPSERNSKPWTSHRAAAAARKERENLPNSAVHQLQSGQKPFRIHLADMDIHVDKGMELSDERVSKILETSDSLYAVAGYKLDESEEHFVAEEFTNKKDDNNTIETLSGTTSFGGHSYDDPNYSRVGPALTSFTHSITPTAKEMEPGYATVEERTVNQSHAIRSDALDSEGAQGYVNDETVSLGEVIDPGYATVRNVLSSGGEDAPSFMAQSDTFSIGEVNDPGYARVKILTLGEDTGGDTEVVIIVDSDSNDDEAVGYSRVRYGRQTDDDDDDDIPDPGYQRIADVRQQVSAVLTRDEVNALYAKVNKPDRVAGQTADDSFPLYSKVMKVKVQDPSALYSKVKKVRYKSPLYSTVNKQRKEGTDVEAAGGSRVGELTVDDVNALYAKVVKQKRDKMESDGQKENRGRRRLPRVPSNAVDNEQLSLRDRTRRMEKKLLQMSCGLRDSEESEEKDKSKPSPVLVSQSQEGLVKKRMEFFARQLTPSSDSEIVVRRKRRDRSPKGASSGASFSSSLDSMSETLSSARTSVNSPLSCTSSLAVSPRESLIEETQTRPMSSPTTPMAPLTTPTQPPQPRTHLEQSDVKSPGSQVSPSTSPALLIGKEQAMQNTWPRLNKDKGKPPVSPNDEIVRVTLCKKEEDVDNPPFGLNIQTKKGGHRLYVAEITPGSVAAQCPKVHTGDELLAVDGKCFANQGSAALAQYLSKVSQVKLKLRRRPRQGVTFKEKLKEKQRLGQDKFSLAESLRLSGSEISLNSMDSMSDRQQKHSPIGGVKDIDHTAKESKKFTQDPNDCVVSQPEQSERMKESIDANSQFESGKLLALSSQGSFKVRNGGREGREQGDVVVDSESKPSVVIRDKRKQKKATVWQRFSGALLRKGRPAGSVGDLSDSQVSASFNSFEARERAGSLDCLFTEAHRSNQAQSTATGRSRFEWSTVPSTATVSSEESLESGSTVPSTPRVHCLSPEGSSFASPQSGPVAVQQKNLQLGEGQVMKLSQTGSVPEAVGDVKLSIIYTDNRMTVEIIEARNLCGQNRRNARIPYVKVYLASSTAHQKLAKRKTKPAKRAADPAFYERLYFSESDLHNKYLKVMVWRQEGSSVFGKNRCIGEAIVSLDGLDLSTKVQSWYKLFAKPHQKSEIAVAPPASRTM